MVRVVMKKPPEEELKMRAFFIASLISSIFAASPIIALASPDKEEEREAIKREEWKAEKEEKRRAEKEKKEGSAAGTKDWDKGEVYELPDPCLKNSNLPGCEVGRY
ncbi:hypothetical protein [Nitrosospira sp. NRS527]|uniref:hypothetical protein n=1 Tax=Nitrosospira sp. NRS527 TaxID=155925 RepID=UPI001AF361C0|nr:hypothetical protein [Nitrosospira sp. NRS527]BCT69251.1 hypothetical protein NNRS527_02866 [Nitrosospira sp. NRS527]